MKKLMFLGAGALAAVGAGLAGYRADTGQWPDLLARYMREPAWDAAVGGARPKEMRRILYWRDPNGKPAYAASPTKTADGRDYVPVHDDEEPPLPGDMPVAAEADEPKGERKILYYRNPMGLPDTSPVPKKDWMGMDYIAVHEGEDDEDGSTVKVSLDRVQRAGVRTEVAEVRHLQRPVRAPAVAKYDERTLHAVTLRADGFIEKLYVNETGAHVNEGQPLFRVYSPTMVNAQVDYRVALAEGARDRDRSLKGAQQKLRNFEIPDAVVEEMRQSGEPVMSIDWPAPASGVVTKKQVVEGQMVRMGEELFMLADLSKIWVIADVAEQDLGLVEVGQPARVRFKAIPGNVYEGRISFILHELEMATRTAKVRIEIANPNYRIRHEMFADVEIDAGAGDEPRIAVPNSAVIHNGDRQVVLVARGKGRFEPREVKLGLRGESFTEIESGVVAGEEVVVSANFLIDAESNLKAALKGFKADAETSTAPPSAAPPQSGHAHGTTEAKP